MAKLADEDGIDIGGYVKANPHGEGMEEIRDAYLEYAPAPLEYAPAPDVEVPTLRDRMLLALVSGPDFARERWESLDQWAKAMWAAADALMATRDEGG